MVPSGMELQPSELQAVEGILQLVAGGRIPGIHAGKTDELVRRHIHKLSDLLIFHKTARAGGIILRQQTQPVQSGAAHLIEDVFQRSSAVLVDIQLPVAQFFPLRIRINWIVKCRMYMNVNGHFRAPYAMPA